jgi:tetrahydromethanopterin S-methyltransferase subunit F
MNDDHYVGFLFGSIFGFIAGIVIAAVVVIIFKSLMWAFI